jgi:hypothetical protein
VFDTTCQACGGSREASQAPASIDTFAPPARHSHAHVERPLPTRKSRSQFPRTDTQRAHPTVCPKLITNMYGNEEARTSSLKVSQRGTIQGDPALNRLSLPLIRGVVCQPSWHRITIQDEPIQHQCKVGVRDAPLSKEVRRMVGKHCLASREQLSCCRTCCSRQRRCGSAEKYHLSRANAVQLRAERHFVSGTESSCKRRAELLTFRRDAIQSPYFPA